MGLTGLHLESYNEEYTKHMMPHEWGNIEGDDTRMPSA